MSQPEFNWNMIKALTSGCIYCIYIYIQYIYIQYLYIYTHSIIIFQDYYKQQDSSLDICQSLLLLFFFLTAYTSDIPVLATGVWGDDGSWGATGCGLDTQAAFCWCFCHHISSMYIHVAKVRIYYIYIYTYLLWMHCRPSQP